MHGWIGVPYVMIAAMLPKAAAEDVILECSIQEAKDE